MKIQIAKMRLLFSVWLLCTVMTTQQLFAQQTISGSQSGTLSPGEYTVTGNIKVETGKTLTIKPGTKFLHDGKHLWEISGELIAQGAEKDSIYFMRKNSSGSWKGIQIKSGAPAATMDYCVVEYANVQNNYDYPSAITVKGGKGLTLTHSRVSHCTAAGYGGAVYVSNTKVLIDHCLVNNNHATGHPQGNGISVKKCVDAKILNSIITGNSNTDNGM